MPAISPSDYPHVLTRARQVLALESAAIIKLSERLDETFVRAVAMILSCEGRVIVTGIGKSGHIARKIAATFASTGTPAFFVHPSEASHGDLGMITGKDRVVALSYSGETDELIALVPHLKREGVAIIALLGKPQSSLGKSADITLDVSVEAEAGSFGLAPTTSTTAVLALGDALALACAELRGFSAKDFAKSHPGGSLGRRLLTRVADVMRKGAALPVVRETHSLREALVEISGKGMGMTAVVDEENRVIGIFTDGDLRRCLEKNAALSAPVAALMRQNPRTVLADDLAADAVNVMETSPKITQLLVVDNERHLIGALHLHDLFRARIL